MEKKKVNFKLKIKVLSPLHIGGKDMAVPFIFYKLDNKQLLRIREEVVFSKVAIDQNSINRFFNGEVSEEDVLYKLNLYGIDRVVEKSKGRNEIIPILRHPNGKAYVPGSSVKGALRLLYLHHKLKNQRTVIQKIEQSLKGFLKNYLDRNKNRQKRGKAPKVENKIKDLLNNGFFIHWDEFKSNFPEYVKVNPQNIDCFRSIVIRDSSFVEESILACVKVFKFDRTCKGFSIYSEFIPKGRVLTLEGYFDKKVAEDLGCPNLLDELIEALNTTGVEIAKSEYENFRKIFENREREIEFIRSANLHIGYGGSIKTCTLFSLFSEELRELILKSVNLEKRNKENYYEPYSRRVIASYITGKFVPRDVIGWVNLKIERQ